MAIHIIDTVAASRGSDIWLADLEKALRRRALFEQATYLEDRIAQADVWLDAHDADDIWYERFLLLTELHASVMDAIALLQCDDPDERIEVCLLLPTDYAGPVGRKWEETDDGEILAWFTRDELETAVWANTALYALTSIDMASAA